MIVEIAAVNIMKHGIKHYSFGQASKFVFVTLVTGTGIGLSVSLVASLFVAGLRFLLINAMLWTVIFPR